MSFYQALRAGTIQATLIVAIPRSVSSALALSLSLSPDIDLHLYEPFYEIKRPTRLWGRVLDRQAEKKSATVEKPLRFVMKALANTVSAPRFRNLINHSERICTLVRDPQSQALSALRAIHENPSGEEASIGELRRLKWRDEINHDVKKYIIKPWQSMKSHLDALSASLEEQRNWCVVEGDLIRVNPETALKRLCEGLHMAYSDEMVNGLDGAHEKTVGLQERGYGESWVGRAQYSKTLEKPTAMTPSLENFSDGVRPHIEANLRIYVWALSSAHALKPQPDELKTLMREGGFHLTCPIACYTLARLWPDAVADERARVLTGIRKELPQYVSSFDIIDAAEVMRPSEPDYSETQLLRAVP